MTLEVVKKEEDRPGEKATATQLPKASGYWLLIALPEPPKEFDSGVAKAKETVRTEEIYSVVGFVLDMGPDAYQDKNKFPTGPWCKKGDFVLMKALSGSRFYIYDKEFRMLADDQIMGTVEDPRGYSAYSQKV